MSASQKSTRSGFTFAELLVVMGTLAILFAFVSINIFAAQRKPALTAVVDQLITDLRQQQVKSMTGDASGESAMSNYGIYFGGQQYVLFRGSSYNASDPNNFSVDISPSMQFSSVLFPGSTILFTRGSGEVQGFAGGSDAVTIQNVTNNETKTITVNRYGTIASVN